jgi:hypothetical protein
MVSAIAIPELDLSRVTASYERRVRSSCGGEFPAALRLERRLDPARWRLEWRLAAWLGDAFGVDPAVTREITLSNALGLACLTLRDDLADGEADVDDMPLSPAEIARRLYDAALDVYRERFMPGSPLWKEIGQRMAQWSAASETAARDARPQLASRGAPLKISAFAMCLLGARVDAFPRVEQALDHALTAMVLYDHFIDWRADLAAGRWNAFVEHMAGVPTAERESAERAVVLAMLTTRNVELYFARIDDELARGRRLAAAVPIAGLTAHLDDLRAELIADGAAAAAHYASLMDAGTSLIFGNHQQRGGEDS